MSPETYGLHMMIFLLLDSGLGAVEGWFNQGGSFAKEFSEETVESEPVEEVENRKVVW